MGLQIATKDGYRLWHCSEPTYVGAVANAGMYKIIRIGKWAVYGDSKYRLWRRAL